MKIAYILFPYLFLRNKDFGRVILGDAQGFLMVLYLEVTCSTGEKYLAGYMQNECIRP